MAVRFTPSTQTTPQSTAGASTVRFKKAPESFWKKIGAEITPEMQAEHPYLSAAGKTAQEFFTTPAEFFNQIAMGYPGRLLEKAGVTLPEPETKGGKIGKTTAGLIGGFKTPIFQAFGGAANLLKAPLRTKALVGGLQFASYPTQEGIFNLKEKPGQFLQGAALGTALPVAGKAIGKVAKATVASPKALEWMARNVSGITDFTKKTVSRLGKKVFAPEYYADDYVGRVFTPNVRGYILDQVDTLGANWKKEAQAARFTSQNIKAFTKMGRTTRKTFVNLLRQGASPLEAAESLAANAKQEYADIINKAGTPINITNTFNKIKSTLLKNGWATEDAAGMLVPKTVLGAPNSSRDSLIRTWNYLRTQGQTIVSPKTKNVFKVLSNGQEFQSALYELEGYLTGDPKRDRVILGVIETLKDDAQSIRTGVIGLKRVSQLYSDAMTLKQTAPKLQRLIDPVRLNAKFAGINAATAAKKYQALEEIRQALPTNLYDDLTAHYAARNFAPEFYPSLSGIRKLGITEASKAYYKKFPQGMQMPAKLQAATRALRGAVVPPAQAIGSGVSKVINEPYFSPETKAGAQALLKNRRGSALIPNLKKKSAETLTLIHFSNQDKPTLYINPKFMGSAQAGAEMKRAGVKTSAHFIEGTEYAPQHEYNWRFGNSTKYISKVPVSKLYNWNTDPLGLATKESSAAERIMKRKGFWGYIAGNPPQVRLFRAVKGTKVPG